MTREAWDYVFLGKPLPQSLAHIEQKLKALRNEFQYVHGDDVVVFIIQSYKSHEQSSFFQH